MNCYHINAKDQEFFDAMNPGSPYTPLEILIDPLSADEKEFRFNHIFCGCTCKNPQ